MEGYEWTRFTPGAEPYASPFGPMGMYYDEETEKYLNWHRYYDPFIGQYLSPEPLLSNSRVVMGELGNGYPVRGYAYAGNNPVSMVDPDGLLRMTTETPAGIKALIAAGMIAPPSIATEVGPVILGGAACFLTQAVGRKGDPSTYPPRDPETGRFIPRPQLAPQPDASPPPPPTPPRPPGSPNVPSPRCRQVAKDCRHNECADDLDLGEWPFRQCVNRCLVANGCPPGMY